MNRNFKRFVSAMLVLVMALSCLSTVAFAETEAPELPTVTVTEIENESLDYALNFATTTPTNDQLFYYGNWHTDFKISFNKDITLNSDGTGNGYVSLWTEAFESSTWENYPVADVTLAAGETFNVMQYIFELIEDEEYQPVFFDLVNVLSDVDLGVYITPEFLTANPDLMVKMELRIYNPDDLTETYVLGETFEFGTPALPTAKVTQITKDDLTFALNFVAEEPTAAQAKYYGQWLADFELTINKDVTFNADGSGDGYLAGQYDKWKAEWVYVPVKSVDIKAGETLKIMEFAADLLGESGLQMTYSEIVNTVNDFDCGVYFTPEFLEANPDLEVRLELRMYNPTNNSESYAIGDTYAFGIPELPTATTSTISKDDLTFAMNFKADEVTEEQLAYYGDWYADFEFTVNKTATYNADESADGYLAGQYDGTWESWNGEWVYVPYTGDVTLEANETLKIMEFAAELMGEKGLKYTYKEVYEVVKDFNCGVYFTPEFIAANPDLEVKLELRMYNPEDESESYTIGEPYSFTLGENVAINSVTNAFYTDVSDAIDEAKSNETVILLKDTSVVYLAIIAGRTLDLNGYTLTADYVASYGDIVDNSEANSGVLVVDSSTILLSSNSQLPVKTDKGYQFVEVLGFNTKRVSVSKYVFQPLFEAAAHEILKTGYAVSGVAIQVKVTWDTGSDNTDYRVLQYGDSTVNVVLNSYKPATGEYGMMFTVEFVNAEEYTNLTCTAQVASDLGVTFVP